jgi:hypothetical protein
LIVRRTSSGIPAKPGCRAAMCAMCMHSMLLILYGAMGLMPMASSHSCRPVATVLSGMAHLVTMYDASVLLHAHHHQTYALHTA